MSITSDIDLQTGLIYARMGVAHRDNINDKDVQGLIVNELLTNTLKYAFPEGQHGKVEIKLHKNADGVLQLQVRNNGVGKSGTTKGTGFGGQLISLLTQQLNSTMQEEVNDGTRISFAFIPSKAA